MSSRPWRLVQITDCHLRADPGDRLRGTRPDARLRAIVERLREERPDLVVVTGDISDDGSLASYRRFLRSIRRIRRPVFCLPGNHDRPDRLRRVLSRRPTHVVEATRHGCWQLCFLDSTVAGRCGGHLSDERWARIEDRLARFRDRPTLIFLHHPVLPSGSRWLDDDMMLDNPERLTRALHAHPQVRALAWGHIHQPFEGRIDGTVCWGTPATSTQFSRGSETFATTPDGPAYRRIQLHADGGLDSEIIYLDGVE